MIQFLLMGMAFLTVLTGCGPRYVDFFPYHDDGTPKPKVAMITVKSLEDCTEPLEEDFSGDIRCEMMNTNRLFLLDPPLVEALEKKAGAVDFLGRDLGFCRCFSQADFIFITEFLECSLMPGQNTCLDSSRRHLVKLKMRLKIMDIRCETPRVILHEIMETSHWISLKPEMTSQICISKEYQMIKNRFVCDIVNRVEEMILCQ